MSTRITYAPSGTYKLDTSIRQALHQIPEVAKARKEMADGYRRMRRDNTKIARMVWRAYRKTKDAAAAAIFSSTNTTGLAELLGDKP